jgi:hypothetical protein
MSDSLNIVLLLVVHPVSINFCFGSNINNRYDNQGYCIIRISLVFPPSYLYSHGIHNVLPFYIVMFTSLHLYLEAYPLGC